MIQLTRQQGRTIKLQMIPKIPKVNTEGLQN